MPELKGSRTHENLKKALSGEAVANRRYLYFARVADVEGYPEVAGLFRDVAEGETGHAVGHLDNLRAVGDPATDEPFGTTRENLGASVAGESWEATRMYPDMAAVAREEGFEDIARWFERLARAESSHAARFRQALETLEDQPG